MDDHRDRRTCDVGAAGRDRDLRIAEVARATERARRRSIEPVLLFEGYGFERGAIHLDRDVNERGLVLNRQAHLSPLLGVGQGDGVLSILADAAEVALDDLLSWDVGLHDLTPSTLAGFDWSLARAAQSLGAPPIMVFRKVILPLILPGVISGALFAWVTSFDEVVVALFISGPDQRTLPKQMFSGIREQISPTITAAATVLVIFSTLLLIGAEMLRRRSERLRGMSPT